jgi:hypothetical protein
VEVVLGGDGVADVDPGGHLPVVAVEQLVADLLDGATGGGRQGEGAAQDGLVVVDRTVDDRVELGALEMDLGGVEVAIAGLGQLPGVQVQAPKQLGLAAGLQVLADDVRKVGHVDVDVRSVDPLGVVEGDVVEVHLVGELAHLDVSDFGMLLLDPLQGAVVVPGHEASCRS